MIFIDILFNLLFVFLFGGFIIFGIKAWEWFEDYSKKIQDKNLINKQKYSFIKLIIPDDSEISIQKMQDFLVDAHVINDELKSNRTIIGHTNLVFEIHACGGQIEVYISAEKSRIRFVKAWLNLHFPEIIAEDTQDPLLKWPSDWKTKRGVLGVRGLVGSELELKNSDIFPLQTWKSFYDGNGNIIKDPLKNLGTSLYDFSSQGYLIIQYLLCPFENDKDEFWQQEIENYTDVAKYEYSPEGENKNIVEQKISLPQFRTKIRWMLAYNSQSKNIDVDEIKKNISNYFNEYTTNYQSLTDNNTVYTEGPRKDFGSLINIALKSGNRMSVFGESEQLYRKKRLYKSILLRDIHANGNEEDNYLDNESLASLFHFYNGLTKTEEKNTENLEIDKDTDMEANEQMFFEQENHGYDENQVPLEQSKFVPPYNLPF